MCDAFVFVLGHTHTHTHTLVLILKLHNSTHKTWFTKELWCATVGKFYRRKRFIPETFHSLLLLLFAVCCALIAWEPRPWGAEATEDKLPPQTCHKAASRNAATNRDFFTALLSQLPRAYGRLTSGTNSPRSLFMGLFYTLVNDLRAPAEKPITSYDLMFYYCWFV